MFPANRRMCRQYGVTARELALAYTEIIAAMRQPFVSGQKTLLAPTFLFAEPGQLEEFLKEIHRATHGQTALQRRLAIIECAKRRALLFESAAPKHAAGITRTKLLKASLASKIPIMLLGLIIAIAGAIIAVYLS